MKEIAFSQLTLDLKKQFIHFLAKHNIDFQRLKDSRFLETKIKLIGANGKPTKVVLKPNDIEHLCRKTRRVNKYHIDCCANDAWSYQSRENSDEKFVLRSPRKSGRKGNFTEKKKKNLRNGKNGKIAFGSLKKVRDDDDDGDLNEIFKAGLDDRKKFKAKSALKMKNLR